MLSEPDQRGLDLNPGQVRDLIKAKLLRTIELAGTQDALAEIMGYESQSSISKILRGRQLRIPVDRAEMVDRYLAKFNETGSPGTLVALVHALGRAERLERQKGTDVFVASPMSAAEDYARQRTLALALVKALERHGLSTYFAGRDIKKRSQFDRYELAYQANLEHIKNSREFVLFMADEGAVDSPAPSSVWVELGMALARNIRCTVFAPRPESLPFVIREGLNEGSQRVLSVRFHGNLSKQPARWVRMYGLQYFKDKR